MAISRGLAFIVAAVLCCPAYAFAAEALPRAKPEDAGMSSARLAEIGKTLNAEIARGRIPGAVVAVARRGKLVYLRGVRLPRQGRRRADDDRHDLQHRLDDQADDGGRRAAALRAGQAADGRSAGEIFSEVRRHQGRRDGRQGKTSSTACRPRARSPIQDLYRHTSGLIYGGRGATPVHKLYPDGSGAASAAMTGPEFLDRLSRVPLLHQPGTVWDYGFGLDVLGLVVEAAHRADARPLPAGQRVQAARHGRHRLPDPGRQGRALCQGAAERSRYRPAAIAAWRSTQPRKFECGGGCAASTGERLPALRAHADEQGPAMATRASSAARRSNTCCRTSSRPRCRNLIGNADPTRADYGFGLGARGAHHARHRAHDGLGRRFLLAGRERHQLVGRPDARSSRWCSWRTRRARSAGTTGR